MKRDDDLIRDMLLRYEAEDDWLLMEPGDTLGVSREEQERGHLYLLFDEGFAAPVGKGTFRLTAQGHDFLSAIKDDSLWKRTKEVVAETGGNATLEIVKSLAVGFLKKKITEHTGVSL